jgi:hypothetical protein
MKALGPVSVIVCLMLIAGSALAQTSISLEGTTYVRDDSVLAGGSTHTFTFRYRATGAPAGRNYLTANGFRVFSPDGADWVSVQGSALQPFSGLRWAHVFVNHFNLTGGSGRYGMPLLAGGGNETGRDTVAILLAGITAKPSLGGLLPSGFDDLALEIKFQSRREDAGLHICIDTCQGAPGAAWEWANPDGLLKPTWSGKRCFVINCCSGLTGDVNGVGGDEPTISDVVTLVDYLFVSRNQPDCLDEADVNTSGTLLSPPLDWRDVTISDVALLVSHLFVNHEPLPGCP